MLQELQKNVTACIYINKSNDLFVCMFCKTSELGGLGSQIRTSHFFLLGHKLHVAAHNEGKDGKKDK